MRALCLKTIPIKKYDEIYDIICFMIESKILHGPKLNDTFLVKSWNGFGLYAIQINFMY